MTSLTQAACCHVQVLSAVDIRKRAHAVRRITVLGWRGGSRLPHALSKLSADCRRAHRPSLPPKKAAAAAAAAEAAAAEAAAAAFGGVGGLPGGLDAGDLPGSSPRHDKRGEDVRPLCERVAPPGCGRARQRATGHPPLFVDAGARLCNPYCTAQWVYRARLAQPAQGDFIAKVAGRITTFMDPDPSAYKHTASTHSQSLGEPPLLAVTGTVARAAGRRPGVAAGGLPLAARVAAGRR
jgi:hypothetical protein